MRKDDRDRTDRPGSDPLLAYIERFASVMTDSGMPRMPARVFAALLTQDDGRLTSHELSDRLDISPAAVSGAVSYLSQVNLVTREREPGTRRDRYRVLDEVWQDMVFERDKILARWEASLAEGVTVVGAGTPAGRRLAESVLMFQFLREETSGMQERWQARRAAMRAEAERGGSERDESARAESGRDEPARDEAGTSALTSGTTEG